MKLFLPLLIIAAVVVIIIMAVKFITAFLAGAFNAILGIIVVIALILIVIWMFSYAKKSK